MRDTRLWYRNLARRIGKDWEYSELSAQTFCEVELGISVVQALMPNEPVYSLWVLLEGYPFPVLDQYNWTPDQLQILASARHLLTYYRSPYPWKQDLAKYLKVSERIRGFDISASGQLTQRQIAFCSDRFDVYTDTLAKLPPYKKLPVRWAQAGTYRFNVGRTQSSVSIPEQLIFDPPLSGHQLTRSSHSGAISVEWSELMATARWMDTRLTALGRDRDARWEVRLERVQLEMFNADGTQLSKSDRLTISGLVHMIGMVGSGKSTLMDVLAVWAAQNNLHITLVVGDVLNALNRADLFAQLGFSVAPILGKSNRERHTNRLHRVVGSASSPMLQDHVGFSWLSSACALDSLRDHPRPLELGAYPCVALEAADAEDDEAFACPIFSKCAFHQAQRDLVDAQIWLATPASLVYSDSIPQITPHRLRFAELVYLRSDLVIVDEADQVQVQLDSIFSPSQTLISRGQDAWLGRLHQQVTSRLNIEGREQLGDERVGLWNQTHDLAQLAANNVYKMLLQEPSLLSEIDQDYFTAWMIFNRLAQSISQSEAGSSAYQSVMAHFETFISDPLGERGDGTLAEIARLAVTSTNRERTRAALRQWVTNLIPNAVYDDEDLRKQAMSLEFALQLEILSNRLEILLRDWKHAELAFQLDGASSTIFHRPPEDYLPVIPVAPMGNVLAYQYLRSLSDDPKEAGDLRVFRCLGIGRWLLLRLNELFPSSSVGGPNVILFSGTSWAGSSPSFHVQTPVNGILRSPEKEVRAISDESTFEYRPFFDAQTGQPIFVSGKRGHARQNALFSMLEQLGKPQGKRSDKPSLLEIEIDNLPEKRQRVLLLVGSYAEAKKAREYLDNLRPDWRGQVQNLVADDDEFESQWQASETGLQRGMVHTFADTGARLLIAPLLAVERGHNILNEIDQAAIGAVYFLVRPHPRPDDLGYAIQSINYWAIENYALTPVTYESESTVTSIAEAFRHSAFERWRYLLRLPLVYSTLPTDEHSAVTWSQLVTLWQVIGRLVRGGSPARVFFCDAAFAPHLYQEALNRTSSSLLVSIIKLLDPYFDASVSIEERDRTVVQTLYGPFYQALKRIEGITNV